MTENAHHSSRGYERNVIACMLSNVDCLEQVGLPTAAFETDDLRIAYETVQSLKIAGNVEVNVSTLRTFFDSNPEFAAMVTARGGWSFLENLASKPDFANFKLHVEELDKRYKVREAKGRAEVALDAVMSTPITEPRQVFEILDQHLAGDDYVAANEAMAPHEFTSDWLDKQTQKFLAGEFERAGIPVCNQHMRRIMGDYLVHGSMLTLAGETNVGKSQWIQLLIRHFCYQQGIPMLVFDNELSKREFQNRTLANISGVRLKHIFNGTAFAQEGMDYQDIKKGVQIMSEIPLQWRQLLDMTADRMEPIIRRFLRQYPKDQFPHKLILVDGIKMQSGNDSYIEVGFFAQRLKGLAQKYEDEGVVLLPTCQLNRGGTARAVAKDKEAHPDHNSIGLSKLISDNSDDVYIMMKHAEVDGQGQKTYSKYHRRLIATKARNHPTFDGANYVLLDFDGSRSYMEPAQSVGPDIDQDMPVVDPNQQPSY